MKCNIKSILNKYTSLPLQAKAAFWFTVCQAVQSGIKFLAMPFLVRLLTTEQYGVYSVFASWTSLISIFATLNLYCGVYNNAMFKFPNKRDSYTSASQSLSATVTIVCLAIYMMFSGLWNSIMGMDFDLIVLMFLQILLTQSYLLWTSRQRYEYRYINLLVFTALLAVSNTAVPIVSALMFPQVRRLRAVIYSGVIVQGLFGIIFMIYNYIKGKCFYNREFWKYALSFNLPLIPHYLSGMVLGQADRVMISRYIGDAEAGIYSFTYNISLVMNIVTSSINSAIIPYTYNKLGKRDYKNLMPIVNFLILIVGGMCLAFSAIAPELFKIVATEDYFDAMYLVPVISLSSYFTFLYSMFANIEFFFEENKFITAASIIGAIANIILNYIFLQIFGYFAAGYTTLFCYILFSVSHYVFMRKACKKHIDGDKVYEEKAILAMSTIFVIAAFGMMSIYNYPIIRYSLIAIGLVFCIIKRKRIIDKFKMIKEK